jgi:hypothetical protein
MLAVLVNNYNNSFLTTNLNRNNIRPTDRTEEIGISTAELILEKDYAIIVLDPVLHLISYLIVRKNIIFIANQVVGLQDIFQSTSKPTIDSASKTNL